MTGRFEKEKKPFRFTNDATHIYFVDAWQYGVRDGLFYFSVGIKNKIEENTGEILFSFVMNPNSAKRFYSDLGRLLNPPKQETKE